MWWSLATSRLGIAAIAVVLGSSAAAGTYIKGRVDGWQNYEDAANAATVKALTDRFDEFTAELAVNRAEGDYARSEIQSAAQIIQENSNEIAGLLDRITCPSDRRVGLRVDTATEAAAAAINRAARRGVDDSAERRGPADTAPD